MTPTAARVPALSLPLGRDAGADAVGAEQCRQDARGTDTDRSHQDSLASADGSGNGTTIPPAASAAASPKNPSSGSTPGRSPGRSTTRAVNRFHTYAIERFREAEEVVRLVKLPPGEKLNAASVYARERTANKLRFQAISQKFGNEPRPFSVALSGGGIRAAAFHCGILWRLAQRGRMKDMEHLALVSGGAYVGTALISFLLAQKVPEGDPDAWYMSRMYELITRMQTESGFMMRFSCHPFKTKSRGGTTPIEGIVLFTLVMTFGFAIIPVTNFMYMALPLALLLDTEVGTAMRLGWCTGNYDEFVDWLWFQLKVSLAIFGAAVLSQFLAELIHRWRECRRRKNPKRKMFKRTITFVALMEVRNVALCAGSIVLVFILAAAGTLAVQWVEHGNGERCPAVPSMAATGVRRCADCRGDSWSTFLGDLENSTAAMYSSAAESSPNISIWPFWLIINGLVAGVAILGSCLKWRILPLRGNHIAAFLSPMWATFVACMVLRWRVFGPVETGDFKDTWTKMSTVVLSLACLILPFYGRLRSLLHLYNCRSLRRAFYHDGRGVPLQAAAPPQEPTAELQASHLCPNVILSACLVDYCRPFEPDDSQHFAEFFFTPRMMGGDRTGFLETHEGINLEQAMTISAAATDAFFLTKMNMVWVRITVLALFNLFMGHHIEFSSSKRQGLWRSRVESWSVSLIFVVFYVAMFLADRYSLREDADGNCELVSYFFWPAWGMLVLVLAASFFACFKGLRWLLSSPIIRHLHMAMMHYHTSTEPPLRLFLNDGGLVECLGLISLLRRKCEWMLVVDATADFNMELVCIRQTMGMAERERLCSFFDPDDPRRGIEPLLVDFSSSTDEPCMRIGVDYTAWLKPEERPPHAPGRTGEIYFIRMRLMRPGRPIGTPRISRAEVLGDSPPQRDGMAMHQSVPEATVEKAATSRTSDSRMSSMMDSEVGGCCCDCCHTRCDCGLVGRFPDFSSGNQFLTPTQFALLCRLGYEISGETVDEITSRQSSCSASTASPTPRGPSEPAHGRRDETAGGALAVAALDGR